MSAFKQKLAKLGATAGVLAGATALMLGVSGISAGSASAACGSTFMEGQGSSLQKIAQEKIWIPAWETNLCGSGTNPKVKYTATSSGEGLKAWRFTGAGTLTTGIAFVGTDDGPSEAQIANARAAANNANVVVVPVAQTAISILVHPPTGCTISTITNAHLDEAFSGKIADWEALGAVKSANPAEKCPATNKLTRVVRSDNSGTSYQFKNYLAKIRGWNEAGKTEEERAASESVPCTGSRKWSALEPIKEGAEDPNIEWPSCGSIAFKSAKGGGGVAAEVVKVEGTIGYAALPDAKAAGASLVSVQGGNVGGKVTFNSPEASSESANCANSKYNVPTLGQKTGGTGQNVDWSQVFGGNPAITNNYPICTLTYDLGWHSYSTAGFGSTLGASVKQYFETVIKGVGSTTKHWYAAVPTSTEEIHNVAGAATLAVGKVE
jgi:ABC-type phosphate transport system substrate-binding protein